MLLTLFVLILGIGLVVFGARAVVRWRGEWRWAALAPLLLVLGALLKIVVEIRADPTSHNLWPFEALGVVMISSAVLGVLELCRIVGARLFHGGHA
jgi:uncharacterized integral membrane protein